MKYLVEDIEAVKKYYPNIDDATFRRLIELDPTYRAGSNSLGKYGKWILNLYKNNNISEDDFEDVTKILNQFNIYRNRIQNKDLNFYKTLDDLSDVLAHVVDDDSMLSDRQKVRFKKNVKAGRIKVDAEDDYDVVFESPKYIVYVPNTHEASMKLGKGTEWCTAHENPDYFDGYTKNGGKLYIVKNKFTDEMWQFSDAFGDFLDENDDDFDVMELLNSDDKLKEFFMKLIGFVGNGEFIYMGATVPDELKDEVITLKVANRVTYIKDYSFCNCHSLESIEIPGSVKEIGENAFNGCTNLSTVIINNGVERIERGAFRSCGIEHIKFPNSISDIGYWAFQGCARLKSITIPENVETVREESFGDCSYLETVNISDGVYTIQSKAFHNCKNLTSVKIPMSTVDVSSYAFIGADDDQLTIYTDNEIVKSDLDKFTLFTIKPERMFKGVSESLKLKISEDTACVPSKISYMNEDGLDDNGIYYFGKKPDKPKNWKDFIKSRSYKQYVKESLCTKLSERVINGVDIPPCPRKEINIGKLSNINEISLRCPDGSDNRFIIFKSKVQAKQYINDLLYESGFPMAKRQMYLDDYLQNKQLYIDDMTEYYDNNEVWLYDSEGQSIWVEADGKGMYFDGSYEDAIRAIKIRNIEKLVMSDSWGEIVYNAFIIFDQWSDDPEDGTWRAVDSISGYLYGSYDDYSWYNLNGTMIQIPVWAKSIKDILKKG